MEVLYGAGEGGVMCEGGVCVGGGGGGGGRKDGDTRFYEGKQSRYMYQ